MTSRFRQIQYGLFAQDSWRVRPNLTLNYGLRWEPQQAPTSQNKTYSKTDVAGVFGRSFGRGLFNPGVNPAAGPAKYTLLAPGEKLYKDDNNNFAPSVGFAYSPDWKNSVLNKLFGTGAQSVFRGGVSIAYVREGLSYVTQPLAGNPGSSRDASLNFSGVALLRNRASFPAPSFPSSPTYPIVGDVQDFLSPSAFDPNLETGYVASWTFGLQRELTKDMVVEARYVGNRGIKLVRRYNVNEVNVIENGFANEFRLAQANLLANRAAGRGNNFRYFGPGTGTSPLPILLSYFAGVPGANASACGGTGQPTCATLYNSSSFANATLITTLLGSNNNVIGLASRLSGAAGFAAAISPTTGDFFFNNGTGAGRPANFFLVNPDAAFAGAALTDNGQHTYYDSMQLELRRRFSKGLLVQANYTFSKSQSNFYAASQSGLNSYVTLRNLGLSKRLSPFDIRHAFKVNYIYELPVGRGKMLFGDANGIVDRIIGGWEVHGTTRVQSGRPFRLGNVQLVGMTVKDLQRAIEVRKQATFVTWLPDDIITNTVRAFTFSSAATADTNGYAPGTAPTGRFIAPPGYGGCLQQFAGQCGFSDVVLHGPRFVRVDMSLVKKIRFTEKTNFEFRTEFLNAINNQNFFIGGSASTDAAAVTGFTTPAFGRITSAYQDTSTTNDPGGRLIQFVARFNF